MNETPLKKIEGKEIQVYSPRISDEMWHSLEYLKLRVADSFRFKKKKKKKIKFGC